MRNMTTSDFDESGDTARGGGNDPRGRRAGNETCIRCDVCICGRARAYYRKFGMCRLCLRDHARKGQIPGLIKASW